MEIISSQPFLIVFYRKVLSPLPLQRKKQSSAEPAPSGGTFPVKGREPFPYFTIPYFLS